MLLYCSSLEDSSSLCSMCSVLEDHFDVQIRKQSLDERFNASCLSFVKALLSELLEEQLQTRALYRGDFWKSFPCVRIKDSTKFKVADQMWKEFKGNGGSLAGICIQYEYDLSTGKILDLRLTSGGGNDRTEAVQTQDQPQAGELVIRDLGYYALDVFQRFATNQVLFLSRLYPKTCVWEQKAGKWKLVDFNKIYQKMLQGNVPEIEMKVFLGNEHKLPVRMILSLVDEQVYEKRIREREKENRKRGQKMSEEVRIRYRFTIYITNAPEEVLPGGQVACVYRLRWQIELIFKCWKSVYKVHVGRKMNQNRYLCMLYAKLILILINLQLTRNWQQKIQKMDKQGNRQLLSIHKVLHTLRKYFLQVYIILIAQKRQSLSILEYLQQKISKDHWLERKKNKQKENKLGVLMV